MQRAVPLSVLTLLSLLSHSAAHAQQDTTYRIRHYDLRIQPDFATREISVTAALEIENPRLEDTLSFELSEQYRVISVRQDRAEPAIDRAGSRLSIKIEPRKTLTLIFQLLAISPKSDDEDRPVIDENSLFLLWSDRFYPVRFEDWATARTTLILPESFQGIAPGRLIRTVRSKGRVIYLFSTSRPAVQFSVFADSRWIGTTRTIHGLRMQTLLYPESQKFSDQIFATSSDVLRFYSDWFGPYAFDQFSFITLTGMYARRAFCGFVGYEPKYLQKEMTSTGFDAHETALLWWGYTSRGRGPGGWQWTEGLGDYAEILYDESRHKPLPRIFNTFRDEYLRLPVTQDVPYTKLRGNTTQAIVHGKYPWLMRVLQYMAGDTPFHNAMRALFQQFQFRTFSMDDFVATVEQSCGKSMRPWREQWLERNGVPEVTLSSSITDGPPYKISGTIEQGVPLYDLPLELGIETARGLRTVRVNINSRQQSFEFDSEEKPSKITIDPNQWLLLRKAYR